MRLLPDINKEKIRRAGVETREGNRRKVNRMWNVRES